MRALRALLGSSRATTPTVTLQLRFGVELTAQAAEALFAAVSGLPRGATVVVETVASDDTVCHYLSADQATADTVSGQLRGLAPSTRIEPAVSPVHLWRYGLRVSWPRHTILRGGELDQAATSVLAALSPLAPGEVLLLRVVLRPGRAGSLPQARDDARRRGSGWFAPPAVEGHVVSALKGKYAEPLLETSVIVAVVCAHPGRAGHLLGRVATALRSRRGVHGQLRQVRLNQRGIARALERPARGGALLTPAEIVGIAGWPVGSPTVPGVSLSGSPLLMPDRRIPTAGRVYGVSTWPQTAGRPLAQPIVGGLSHALLVGPSGVGKSSLVEALVLEDLAQGRGCMVIDGKGDLLRRLTGLIPAARLDDVIVLDPADRSSLPGLRVFGDRRDPELAGDVVLGVLRDLFRDSWGVRSDQWLRVALASIASDPGSTLGDLPYLFSDDAYRQRLVARLTDPFLLSAWAAYAQMKPGERANQLGAPLNKITELLGRRVLRAVLSNPKPALDMHAVMRRNQVVLASIAPAQLGGPASRLLGALLVHQLFAAVQARASLPPAARTPFFAYIDEPQVLGDIPVPLESMFELARGMGVGLHIATQSLTQLAPATRSAALTNSGTIVAYRQTADDADLLARQLGGVTSNALQHLDPFEIIARLGLGPGEASAPVSGKTLLPPPPTSDPDIVRRHAAKRYGADPAEIDRLLRERHQPPPLGTPGGAGAVGRRRRNE